MEPNDQSLFVSLTTVRIVGIGGPRGKPQVGTGFFLDFVCDGGRNSRWLVTNRHTVEGCAEASLRLHAGVRGADGTVRIAWGGADLVVINPTAITVYHPAEDLCALSAAEIGRGADTNGVVMAAESLSEQMIPTQAVLEGMSVAEDVLVVGYPAGRMDEANGLPVARRGCTASHPGLKYNGRSRGMLDVPIYFGSSGSPVLVWDTKLSLDAGQLREQSRKLLLGVVVDHESDDVEGGVLINGAPTAPAAVARVGLPLHLGSYIRAEALLSLKEAIRTGGRLA